MKCTHERFEEQAVRTPGATALIDGDERLGYAELDARADRFAGLLMASGVRHGDTVGVFLERSAALVVTVLGVLKAGAGYVILDPAFPAERLRAMAADAGIAAVVSTRDADPGVPGVPRVYVEDAPSARPLARGAVPVRPDDIACVMFTSGSTGRPKGIAASHHAVTATLTDRTSPPSARGPCGSSARRCPGTRSPWNCGAPSWAAGPASCTRDAVPNPS